MSTFSSLEQQNEIKWKLKLSTKSLFKEVNLNCKVGLNSEHLKDFKGNSQAFKCHERVVFERKYRFTFLVFGKQ